MMKRKIKLRKTLAECKNADEIEKYIVTNDGLTDKDHEHIDDLWETVWIEGKNEKK